VFHILFLLVIFCIALSFKQKKQNKKKLEKKIDFISTLLSFCYKDEKNQKKKITLNNDFNY